jgi:hypothetical protein
MTHHSLTILLAAGLLYAHTPAAHAQSQPQPAARSAPQTLVVGGSIGHIFNEYAPLTTVSVRVNRLHAQGAGIDFAFTTLPAGLPEGAFVFAQNVGVAVHSVRPDGAMMLRAGGTLLGSVGSGGGGAMVGGYVGASAIIRLRSDAGVRIDATRYAPVLAPQYGIYELAVGVTKFSPLH